MVGGALSLAATDEMFSRSLEMFQSAVLFIDWLNSERGGLRVGGRRYAMRTVYVGDASDEYQVANATAVAVRGSATTFAMGPSSSSLTYFAAQQSFADGALMIAAYASGPEVISQNGWTFGTLPAEYPGVYDKTA